MIYFLIYLFIEVMVSSFFITMFGGLLTFLEILISAILGIFILKSFSYSLQENIEKIRSGKMSQEEFIATNASRSLGAILLIIPGFFTDILGIFLQFGILIGLFGFLFKSKNTNMHYTNNTHKTKEQNNEIIDVEVIEHSSSSK